MGKGMQPVGVDVIATDRHKEREELVTLFMRDGEIDPVERRFLARHDMRSSRVEQIVHATWIGMAWFRSLTPQGSKRVRELQRDYAGQGWQIPEEVAAVAD